MTSQIYVAGNSRSGTTLLAQVIGMNSHVHTLHEVHFFERLCDRSTLDTILGENDCVSLLAKLLKTQESGYLSSTVWSQYKQEATEIFENQPFDKMSYFQVYQLFLSHIATENGCGVVCEQTPRNQFYYADILKRVPDARLVYIYRNALDVLASQKHKWKLRKYGASKIPVKEAIRSWANYHPITTSLMWRSGIRNYIEMSMVMGDDLYRVGFEELLNSQDKALIEICKFCNIEYEDSMLEVPTYASSHSRKDMNAKGLSTNAISRWKNQGLLTNPEIWWCQYLCKNELKFLGYETDGTMARVSLAALLLLITFPIKLMTSLVLNFGKYKNPFKMIFERLNL